MNTRRTEYLKLREMQEDPELEIREIEKCNKNIWKHCVGERNINNAAKDRVQ